MQPLRRRRSTCSRFIAVIAVFTLCFLSIPSSALAEEANETVPAKTALPTAASFAVMIPDGFVPDSTPGRYICDHYPLDSANITVTSTSLTEMEHYTNAEKRDMEERGEEVPPIRQTAYTELTAKDFEASVNASLTDGLTLSVTSFECITLRRVADDARFPGFHIIGSLNGAIKPILQEPYLVLSRDRVFTVTYAQASDDGFDELFRQSIATISVY